MNKKQPLFAVDPADGERKHVGDKLVHPDGTITWFKRIKPEHVMRLGQLGFDAGTYDMHFKGRRGSIRVERGTDIYAVNLADAEKVIKRGDYGHGVQVFIELKDWTKVVTPKRTTPGPKLIFGQSRICDACDGTGVKQTKVCPTCKGERVVT